MRSSLALCSKHGAESKGLLHSNPSSDTVSLDKNQTILTIWYNESGTTFLVDVVILVQVPLYWYNCDYTRGCTSLMITALSEIVILVQKLCIDQALVKSLNLSAIVCPSAKLAEYLAPGGRGGPV